jgi:hypothetical protein
VSGSHHDAIDHVMIMPEIGVHYSPAGNCTPALTKRSQAAR